MSVDASRAISEAHRLVEIKLHHYPLIALLYFFLVLLWLSEGAGLGTAWDSGLTDVGASARALRINPVGTVAVRTARFLSG
jgi:hypothetical protein